MVTGAVCTGLTAGPFSTTLRPSLGEGLLFPLKIGARTQGAGVPPIRTALAAAVATPHHNPGTLADFPADDTFVLVLGTLGDGLARSGLRIERGSTCS